MLTDPTTPTTGVQPIRGGMFEAFLKLLMILVRQLVVGGDALYPLVVRPR